MMDFVHVFLKISTKPKSLIYQGFKQRISNSNEDRLKILIWEMKPNNPLYNLSYDTYDLCVKGITSIPNK